MIGCVRLGMLLFLALSASASAQNANSRMLTSLPVATRNASLLLIIQSAGELCDEVVDAHMSGSVEDRDDWKVTCRDGNTYCLGLYGDESKESSVVSCDELVVSEVRFIMSEVRRANF